MKLCGLHLGRCGRYRNAILVYPVSLRLEQFPWQLISVFFSETFAQFIYRISILLFGSQHIMLCYEMSCVPILVSHADIFRYRNIMLLFDGRITVVCWSQPINNQCCGWIGPYGSYYDWKLTSAITIRRKFVKDLLHILEITWHV